MDSKKKYKCTFDGCTAKFLRPSRLLWHTRIHNGEKPFECTFENCDKAYTNSSHLKRHLQTHKMIQKLYLCPICPKKFTESHNLKRHCLKHHDEKGMYCKDCNKWFKKQEAFEADRTMHKRLKISKSKENVVFGCGYECSQCGKKFSCGAKLDIHKNVHKLARYTCLECKKNFENREDFCDHLKTNHRKDHVCETCDRFYVRKINYLRHLQVCKVKTQEEAETFSCPHDHCDRIYFYKRNLETHIRIVHRKENYTCDYCGAKYKAKITLMRHILNVHIYERQKPGKNSKSRKKRKDAGIPKRSEISKLIGVDFPPDFDKELLYQERKLVQSHNITNDKC